MRFRVIGLLIILAAVGCIGINACQNKQKPESVVTRKKVAADNGNINALPLDYSSPPDNPSNKEKIELGRLLFYDPILSGGKDVSCATCHHPEFGYAESLELSIGVNGKGLGEQRVFNHGNDIPFTKRNAQSLLNTAFNGIDRNSTYSPALAPMFWDLRAKSLEEQAMLPVKTLEEMRGHGFEEQIITKEIVARIQRIKAYQKLFDQAFGESNAVTEKNISRALAAFQRSLIANQSRFDKYMRGDKSAMSTREIEGMQLFVSTGCASCHSGPMFSDFKTHVLGVADNDKLAFVDSGFQQSFAFRTPSLRNLRFTRPYMHNGKIPTLESVLTFYEDLRGKDLPNKHIQRSQVDTLALQLKLEFKNISTIIEFLNALNDDKYDKTIPASVPSGLTVGGKIQ